MEPCKHQPGVLFSHEELPDYLEVLQEVVRHPMPEDSVMAAMVLSAIQQSRKLRDKQPTFVPAPVAMDISRRLQHHATESEPTVTGLFQWASFVVHVAPAGEDSAVNARAIEAAVIESHRLNR
jgi:hypothetical protein